jgi:hypothetical protein
MFCEFWLWLNSNAGGVSAIATIALVVVTGIYIFFTAKSARAAEKSAKVAELMAISRMEQQNQEQKKMVLISCLKLTDLKTTEALASFLQQNVSETEGLLQMLLVEGKFGFSNGEWYVRP